MDTTKRTIIFFVIIFLLAAGLNIAPYLTLHRGTDQDVLHVGAGDDITGLLMEDVAAWTRDTDNPIELNLFMDCCGSAAQWAMTSGDLDVGFYCGSIALALVNRSSDLEIYGPAVMNAEVAALGGGGEEVGTIAVPMKRGFLHDIVYESFPDVTEISQASTTSLHYALSGGGGDGVVVDVAKALQAPGFNYVPLSGKDYVSYCLVVNKSVLGTPQFAEFLKTYNLAADHFNSADYLKDRYDMADSFWQAVNVKFLYFD